MKILRKKKGRHYFDDGSYIEIKDLYEPRPKTKQEKIANIANNIFKSSIILLIFALLFALYRNDVLNKELGRSSQIVAQYKSNETDLINQIQEYKDLIESLNKTNDENQKLLEEYKEKMEELENELDTLQEKLNTIEENSIGITTNN